MEFEAGPVAFPGRVLDGGPRDDDLGVIEARLAHRQVGLNQLRIAPLLPHRRHLHAERNPVRRRLGVVVGTGAGPEDQEERQKAGPEQPGLARRTGRGSRSGRPAQGRCHF